MTNKQVRDRVKARCGNDRYKAFEYLGRVYEGMAISTEQYCHFYAQLDRGIEPDNLDAKMTGKQT